MSGDWRGTLWTLLVTFCIVIIRCTETFWSLCIMRGLTRTQLSRDIRSGFCGKICNVIRKLLMSLWIDTTSILPWIRKQQVPSRVSTFLPITWRHIPEDFNTLSRRCGNYRSWVGECRSKILWGIFQILTVKVTQILKRNFINCNF
jgi:hypothetical protein